MTDKEILDKYINIDGLMYEQRRKEGGYGHAAEIQRGIQSKRWNRHMSQYWSGDRCYR